MTRLFIWLGILVPLVLAGAVSAQPLGGANAEPAAEKPVMSWIEQLLSDPLAFNSWCYSVLFNQGARFGYPVAEAREQAGFAMADAIGRFRVLSEAAGVDSAARDAFDQAMLAETIGVAQSAAAASLKGSERALHDACTAKGVQGARYKALYVDPVEGMHANLWCASVLAIFDQRRMVGGGAERVARAQRALSQLNMWKDRIFRFLHVPPTDRQVLEAGYHFRALVQVEGFNISQGDKGRFERDYESCFPLEALQVDEEHPEPPPPPPDRPTLTAAGWDFPLSSEFRFHAWCYGAMHYISDGNMPADSTLSAQEAEGLIGDLHFRMLREASGLGLDDEALATMEVESYHQAAYEFTNPHTFGGEPPLSYDYKSCPRAAVDMGSLLDVDKMQSILDELQAPQPDAEFNDAVWCLAGLERVLGSETDREKRSALKQGLESLSNTAARLGRDLGLSGEKMMARLTEMKPVVDAEIRSRRRDDGKLMIAVCLERGLGYSDVFYDWVDP